MSMAEPEWFRYVEWDYSDPSFPVMKGLRKDTPPELVKKLEEKGYSSAAATAVTRGCLW